MIAGRPSLMSRQGPAAGRMACALNRRGDHMNVESGIGRLSTSGQARPSHVPIASTSPVGEPAPRGLVIERRRLLERLSQAVDEAPLTLVCAPAGSGKT